MNNKALGEPFGALWAWLLIQFWVLGLLANELQGVTVHSNKIRCKVPTPFPITYFCNAAFYKHKTADQNGWKKHPPFFIEFYHYRQWNCQETGHDFSTSELEFSLCLVFFLLFIFGFKKRWWHSRFLGLCFFFLLCGVMTLSIVITHLSWQAYSLSKHWTRTEDSFSADATKKFKNPRVALRVWFSLMNSLCYTWLCRAWC